MDRRAFFKRGLKDYLLDCTQDLDLKEILDLFQQNQEKDHEKDYFNSFFSCYPLLAESPMEQLIMAAEQLGIDHRNKTKLELAKEIFSGKQGKLNAYG